MRPQSAQELIWEYIFVATTAGLGVILTKVLQARKFKKVMQAWKKGILRGKKTIKDTRTAKRIARFAKKRGWAKKKGLIAETLNRARRKLAGERIIFARSLSGYSP